MNSVPENNNEKEVNLNVDVCQSVKNIFDSIRSQNTAESVEPVDMNNCPEISVNVDFSKSKFRELLQAMEISLSGRGDLKIILSEDMNGLSPEDIIVKMADLIKVRQAFAVLGYDIKHVPGMVYKDVLSKRVDAQDIKAVNSELDSIIRVLS